MFTDIIPTCDHPFHRHTSVEDSRSCTLRGQQLVVKLDDLVKSETKRDTYAAVLPGALDYPATVQLELASGFSYPLTLLMTVEGDHSYGDCGIYRQLDGLISSNVILILDK